MSLDPRAFRKINPTEFHRRFLSHDLRPDGRNLHKARLPSINAGIINTAIGSAAVRIGSTSVVAGIKAEVAQPLDSEPNNGFIVVNVELGPLCSSEFRPGRPSDEGQFISQQIYKLINKGGVIDRKQLCIEEATLVWVLYVDVICLDHDGSVLDASLLAVMAALRSVKLPSVVKSETGDWVTTSETVSPLKLECFPIALSFAVFEDKMLVDPTYEEESIASDVFTIIQNHDGVQYGFIKPGGVPLSKVNLQKAFQFAKQRANHISALLE